VPFKAPVCTTEVTFCAMMVVLDTEETQTWLVQTEEEIWCLCLIRRKPEKLSLWPSLWNVKKYIQCCKQVIKVAALQNDNSTESEEIIWHCRWFQKSVKGLLDPEFVLSNTPYFSLSGYMSGENSRHWTNCKLSYCSWSMLEQFKSWSDVQVEFNFLTKECLRWPYYGTSLTLEV
jgi:hypothetical protein